jgi:hypothetical protein
MARAVISDPKRRAALEPIYDHDLRTGVTLEVFFADHWLATSFGTRSGWFWWHCKPGSLPDLPPTGPFGTSYAAYRNASDGGKRLFVKEALFGQSVTRGGPNTWRSHTSNWSRQPP